LLLQAAARLQAIKDGWNGNRADLDDALLYNRKLWTIFLTSVTGASNPLPTEIRQNVANLGIFVMKQTIAVMSNPQPNELASLISINRELAAGLRARA
jgi:flagellar biosynthesis activator protein FlaF